MSFWSLFEMFKIVEKIFLRGGIEIDKILEAQPLPHFEISKLYLLMFYVFLGYIF